jgi:uncharacterized membrane protein YidH (DUF202 family)
MSVEPIPYLEGIKESIQLTNTVKRTQQIYIHTGSIQIRKIKTSLQFNSTNKILENSQEKSVFHVVVVVVVVVVVAAAVVVVLVVTVG